MAPEPKIEFFSSPWCLMVYPDVTSAAIASPASSAAAVAESTADYWSKRLKCNIRYLASGELFLKLEISSEMVFGVHPMKIISETGIVGYILPYDYCAILALEI
jgi:hypothetical protein